AANGSMGAGDVSLFVANYEDFRMIENDWKQIWYVSQPSHMTPERVHGGIEEAKPADEPLRDPEPARHRVSSFNVAIPLFRPSASPVADLARPYPGETDLNIIQSFSTGDMATFSTRLSRRSQAECAPQLYSRPSFTNDPRLFSDLVAYAPGMNTSRADIQAVLEAEAAPELRVAPGRIEPAARKLIERARSAGWQALTIPNAFTLFFDGRGRYAYERVLPLGLRERAVCDGATLLHLYPELGIGARRNVSRFHRAELLRAVPWLVPPAEDLARGADVKYIDEHTVAVVPPGLESTPREPGGSSPRYVALQLIFAEDGRLAERRLVAMPSKKVIVREAYLGGAVKVLDGKDNELGSYKLAIAKAAAPNLRPDTSQLVLLPLPLRSRERVYEQFALDPKKSLDDEDNGCFEDLSPDDAMQLFAANYAASNGDDAGRVYRSCFYERGERKLGFYTLLAACGVNVSREPEFLDVVKNQGADAPRSPLGPLARYLALQGYDVYTTLQQRFDLNWGRGIGPPDSFLQRLASFRDLHLRWQNGANDLLSLADKRARQERALRFVRENRSNIFGLAALVALDDHAGDSQFRRDIGAAWKLFEDTPGLGYVARYEQARSLFHGGQAAEARHSFRELYEKTLKEGSLPPIQADFRQALGTDGWNALMRQTATKFIQEKRRPAAVALAWQ
ncbi:MAG TPA: hypothetical protein VKI65_07305, partial [Gemmataceae bacterium]|nr:hypothetical protein [Gemmataceae bacterium]